MHLEDLIDELGGFGPYQIIRVIILCTITVVVVPSMLMMGFAAYEPDWWCASRDQDHNLSNLSYYNESFKNCNWNGTCDRRFTDSMETVVSEWNLVCDLRWVSSTITSVQMAGLVVGGIISGYTADSYGRKKTFYTGVVLLFAVNIIIAFSVSWIMFIILCAVSGLAISLIFGTVYLYHIEFVGNRWRVFIAAIPDWAMGMIVQFILTKWLHHWKWIHLVLAAIIAPLIPTYFFVDESVRWLTVKGHLQEARHVINRMATMNRKSVPDTSILELIAEEERTEGDKAKNYNYLDLFKTKELAKKTAITSFAMCSFSMMYYGIYFGMKDLSGDLYMNMLFMALTELPVTPVVIIITHLCSRRFAAISGIFLTSGVCFGLVVCTRYVPADERGTFINGLTYTAKVTISINWLIMVAFRVELFPTVIRNQAFAFQSTWARVGGVLGAQLFLLGGSGDVLPPFLSMAILSFLTGLACLPLEETWGKPLQDTMTSVVEEKTNQDITLETEVYHEMETLMADFTEETDSRLPETMHK